MGNFKVYTTFNESLSQTTSAWKCLKLNFAWGPLTTWKFEPSPRAHTHSDPIINKTHRAAPQTSTLTLASYSPWTSTSLHSICFINSFHFLFCFFVCLFVSPRGFLQSTARPHQSTARPLQRATSHIKVTHPPYLFLLLPWENVNRSTTLIYCMWLMSSR